MWVLHIRGATRSVEERCRPARRETEVMVLRLPLAGEEKTTLHVGLTRHREAVLWKLEGLDDEQLRRPMVP